MAKFVLKDSITALNKVITGLETTSDAVKKDLKLLANKLSMINDADLPLHHLEVRTWLANVLDVVIALHELVEKLAADDHSMTSTWNSYWLIPWARDRRFQHTDKIKQIEATLDLLVDSKPSPQWNENSRGSEGAVQVGWVGRKEEEKKVTQQLLSDSNTNTTIPIILPIVGIQGLGKTALARHVYHKLKNSFELKIWVQSGKSFHENLIVNSIVRQATQAPQLQINYGHMQNRLSEAIGGRRYLLVLDDVKSVDPEEWDRFRKILPSGVSILITTPSVEVGRITGTVPPLELQGLNEDDSWLLFKRIASSLDESDTSKEVGDIRKMVQKCKGVPLAIEIMGSLWSPYPDFAIKIKSMEEMFQEKLALIYLKELPFPLKLCFAFCSLFSDNDVIDIPRLINLWIAERYVLPRLIFPSLEYEAVGKEYFQHLYRRSIFQDLQEDELGNPTSCRMHPLMHSLAVFVARDEHISSVRPDGNGVKSTVRHVSFDFRLDVSSAIPKSLSAELLTIFLPAAKQSGIANEKMSYSTCKMIFTKFKRLHVLDLHDLGIGTVPGSIGTLSPLRYLDLSSNNMEKLPDSITNLKHLQTLKLSNCQKLTELPQNLYVLTRLRHLEIDKCKYLSYMECMKEMTSLRTLSTSDSTDFWKPPSSSSLGNASVRGLANLNKLRGVLEIAQLQCCLVSDAAQAKLLHKVDLECLILRWESQPNKGINAHDASQDKFLESLDPPKNLKALSLVGYGGTKLSHWLSLQRLVKFSLSYCNKCESLRSLYDLQSLKILKLQNLSSLKFVVDNESGGSSKEEMFLESLKKLTISNCPALTSWWEKEIPLDHRPSFPSISILEVKFCSQLKCMPLCGDLDENLVVKFSSVKPILLDTIKGPNKSKNPPFSKLKCMQIANIKQGQPTKNWLQNFTSLERLHIQDYSQLKSLHEGFPHLISLEDLIVENCRELDLMKDSRSDAWGGLRNLRTLTIREIPKLERLPRGLECVTTLQELRLHDCSSLTSLTDNIDRLVSLQTLEISKCDCLAFQPQALESLRSTLSTFTIDGRRPTLASRNRHI